MGIIKKKLCLMGSFGVGKTSLIRQYVLNVYSESYLSTVGVKVDKKIVALPSGEEVVLMIWDMEGRDDFKLVADTYLRGMSGYFLVADGTRPETLSVALSIGAAMRGLFPGVRSSLLVNKADLKDRWAVPDSSIRDFTKVGDPVFHTSAKLGSGVEEAFTDMAARMVGSPDA